MATEKKLVPEIVNDGQFVVRPRAEIIYRRRVGDDLFITRRCKNCPTEFEHRADKPQDFCCRTCRSTFLKRRQRRGLMIIDQVMRWRINRSDKKALTDLCNTVSQFLQDDKARGRSSW